MSIQGLSTTLSALLTGSRRMDLRANNLANLTTTGYKTVRPDQVDLSSGGVRLAATQRMSGQGPLILTDNPLDVAVHGEGFFQVDTSNGTRYTRAGSFHIDAAGRIVTSSGQPLSGGFTVPDGAQSVAVGANGQLQAVMSDGTLQDIGRLPLTRFRNPAGLSAEGGNLLSETPASGAPINGFPNEGMFGSVQSGMLEDSNVDLATETVGEKIDLHTFRANLAMLKTQDELLEEMLRIKR